MPQRRFSLTDLFLFVACCSLLLAFFVPLIRQGANRGNYVQGRAFSADGSTVAALLSDGKVRVWRASDQALVATLDSSASPFGNRIAISSVGALAAVFTGFAPRKKRRKERAKSETSTRLPIRTLANAARRHGGLVRRTRGVKTTLRNHPKHWRRSRLGTKLPAAGGFLPKSGGDGREIAAKSGFAAQFPPGIRFA